MNHPLRPYQSKNIAELLGCLARDESPLHVLPTGGGKTEVFCHVIADRAGAGWDCAVFVHRVELIRQASDRLTLMGISHGIIDPGHDLTSHRVHVASIDTVGARIDALEPWLRRIDLAVPDEAHHAVAPKWERALKLPRRRQGATATPCRFDGKGLGDTGLFHRIIPGPSVKELTLAGYLAPAHIYAPPTGLDLSRVAKRGGDFALGQLAEAVDVSPITEMALAWYDRIALPLILSGQPPPPAVAFCTTVEHAQNVAQAFRDHGVLSHSVDGKMAASARKNALAGLADGSVQVLTSCDLIGEGLDIPAVAAAILLRPTKSTSLYLQQVGRALRPHPDKSHADIIDLAGNAAMHGMYDATRLWTLRDGIKGIERAVAATWRCRRCHRVRERPDETTVMHCDCGGAQSVNGFALAAVDSLPPIAGIPAEVILRMPWKDALKACRTIDQLLAFAHARGVSGRPISNPAAWARMVLAQREAYRQKFAGRRR